MKTNVHLIGEKTLNNQKSMEGTECLFRRNYNVYVTLSIVAFLIFSSTNDEK